MTATAAGTSADGPPAKKKRGSSGNPRGVIETSSGKFQGRVNYKPPGVSKGQLRGIGTFDTPEEAGQAVTAAEAGRKRTAPALSRSATAAAERRQAPSWRYGGVTGGPGPRYWQ